MLAELRGEPILRTQVFAAGCRLGDACMAVSSDTAWLEALASYRSAFEFRATLGVQTEVPGSD